MIMDISTAQKTIGVNLPISLSALKAAFRRKALTMHPDHGGSHEGFLKLNEAFKVLSGSTTMLLVADEVVAGATCIDGTPLEDLGKGYPITKAACACSTCSGKGYVPDGPRPGYECPHCDGQGKFIRRDRKCPACNGYGGDLFAAFSFSRFARVCRVCRGMGSITWLRLKRPITCRFCNGTGMREGGASYRKCYECKGIGEKKMWNPVLHRGLLGIR